MTLNNTYFRHLLTLLALFTLLTTTSIALPELQLPSENKSSGLVMDDLSFQPKAGVNASLSQRIKLPEYDRYCWFASEDNRWPAEVNRCLPWSGASLKELFREAQNPICSTPGSRSQFALFSLKDGRYLALLPVPGNACISWLKTGKDGDLWLETGTLGTLPFKEKATPRLCWAVGDNAWEASRRAWQLVFSCKSLSKETLPRSAKNYPQAFRYLGWCSWEQYKKNISMELLLNVVGRIKQSPLPIRWVLVDDGFQQQQDLRLKSFAPNPRTFPNGWSPLLAQKDEKIRWMGLWHCYFGLWNGIDLTNDLGEALNKGLVQQNKALYPGNSAQSTRSFYNAFMGSVRQAGFDFVKIDVQAEYLKKLMGQPNPSLMNTHASQALEEACRSHKLGLLNCMAHGPINMFHTRYSAITRCSIDYTLGDANQAKSHIYQSYANTLWLGQTVWPDHDMFHSSDPLCGRLMAVSKALSGGPVYLSDAPEHFKADLIMPLCRSTGELYRPLAPAVPLPDSVFVNPFTPATPYRVVAPLPNGTAAVAVYNLTRKGEQLQATLSPEDYRSAATLLSPQEKKSWQTASEGLVYFNYYDQTGEKLDKPLSIALQGFSDRLFLLAPIVHGWAVIGLSDKYLSPCGVQPGVRYEDKKLTLTLDESGDLVIWSANGEPTSADGTKAQSLGQNFWKFSFPAKSGKQVITLTR